MYTFLANFIVGLHLTFVVFTVFGVLLVPWKRWIAYLHIAAIGWIALNQFVDWQCPLTVLEKWLRSRAGDPVYSGGFINHYLLAPIGRTAANVISPFELLLLAVLYAAYYGYIFRPRGKTKPN